MSESLTVTVSGRGSGRIVTAHGARVVLECGSASPPGSSLSCAAEGLSSTLKIKVTSCRKSGEGTAATFRIEGRFVDLTREQRLELERRLQGSS